MKRMISLALADKTGISGNFYDRTFFVGLNGTGVLEVEDGRVFEGRLQVGGCAESQGDGGYYKLEEYADMVFER